MMKIQKTIMITATLALGLSACGGGEETTDAGVDCSTIDKPGTCLTTAGCQPVFCAGNAFKACGAGEPNYALCGPDALVNYGMWVDSEHNGWDKYETEFGQRDPIVLNKTPADGKTMVRLHVRRDLVNATSLGETSFDVMVQKASPAQTLAFAFEADQAEIMVEWEVPNDLDITDGKVTLMSPGANWTLDIKKAD